MTDSPMTATADDIRRILSTCRTIAMVGASDKPGRPSHGVMRFLQAHGYRVIPVNPRLAGRKLLGERVFGTLEEIDVPIDMVDVFRRPEETPAVARSAVALGAGTLWLQLGVINHEAAAIAQAGGLDVVMDRCPAIEIPRLAVTTPKTPSNRDMTH